MRKGIILFSALVAISAFMLTGCKKDDAKSTPATIDLSKSTLIQGLVKANLTTVNDTTGTSDDLEFAPAGTKIIFQMDASEYPLVTSGTYDHILYTATVGSDGKYSISIPTTNRGVTVTITPVEFLYDQVKRKWSGTGWVADGTIRKLYTAAPATIPGLITGNTQIVDFTYN